MATSTPGWGLNAAGRPPPGVNATGPAAGPSSSTNHPTGRSKASASFNRVVMVGTIPLRSILWMAAADTPARSASCCRDRPRCRRSSRSRGPMAPTIRIDGRQPLVDPP